jgi:hypothetical protein
VAAYVDALLIGCLPDGLEIVDGSLDGEGTFDPGRSSAASLVIAPDRERWSQEAGEVFKVVP